VARGYTDYLYEQEPNYMSVAGDPFAAEHYYEGYGLAAYKLGNLTMSVEQEQLAAR